MKEQPANASMNVIDKINAISFFTLKASFIKSLFIVLFYRATFPRGEGGFFIAPTQGDEKDG